MAAEKRRCEYRKCGKEYVPTRGFQKHCTRECGQKVWESRSARDRRARKATKHERHPKAQVIYEMLKEAAPGECPWGCEKPLPPQCRTCCHDEECRRAYRRAYRIGRTRVEQDAKRPIRRAACKCGCGGTLVTRYPPGRHDYLRGHRPKVRPSKSVTFSALLSKFRGAA